MCSGPSCLQPWILDPSNYADIHLWSGTHCPQSGRAAFPRPFGICLVSIPSPKCLMVGAASGEMTWRPAHKTLSLFPLIVAHCLGQVHIKATYHFYFRLRVLPCDMIRQRQPLFLQGCHLAHWHEVAPVLVPIHFGDGGIPARMGWLSCF